MRHKTELFIWSPFLLAVIAAYYKSVWLVAVTVILCSLWWQYCRLPIREKTCGCLFFVVFAVFQLISF